MQDRIAVVGMGYVGLTMATCMADMGVKTIGIEIDEKKIDLLKRGKSPFHEPHLEKFFKKTLKSRKLQITKDYLCALKESDIVFITVGTPSLLDGSMDPNPLKSTSNSIGKALKNIDKYLLIVLRSTILPGTGEKTKTDLESISGIRCGRDFGLCVNPEFLSEGSALKNMQKPDKIVIGEYDKKSGDILENFYHRLNFDNKPKIIRTSLANAELIKYANNTFLATKISFINSMANLCKKIPKSDIKVIAKGIGYDPRISPLFLDAGLGWGGSCFPKDMRAIFNFSKKLGVELSIINAAIKVNESQPILAVKEVKSLLGKLKGKRIAILGLAFKPNTDDMRESVSVKIIDELRREGAKIIAYDPKAMENAKNILGKLILFANSAKECIENAECCIIVTEWDEFKRLKPDVFIKSMSRPLIIDGRRIYNPKDFSKLEYHAVGLGNL